MRNAGTCLQLLLHGCERSGTSAVDAGVCGVTIHVELITLKVQHEGMVAKETGEGRGRGGGGEEEEGG